jgi:hypothetical protein
MPLPSWNTSWTPPHQMPLPSWNTSLILALPLGKLVAQNERVQPVSLLAWLAILNWHDWQYSVVSNRNDRVVRNYQLGKFRVQCSDLFTISLEKLWNYATPMSHTGLNITLHSVTKYWQLHFSFNLKKTCTGKQLVSHCTKCRVPGTFGSQPIARVGGVLYAMYNQE